MEIGVQLRILREYNKFSRDIMSDLIGVSTNTYQKIESGERIPNIIELELISEKLGVDTKMFLKNDGSFNSNSSHSTCIENNNTVSIDKDLLKALLDTLNKLNEFLDRK